MAGPTPQLVGLRADTATQNLSSTQPGPGELRPLSPADTDGIPTQQPGPQPAGERTLSALHSLIKL